MTATWDVSVTNQSGQILSSSSHFKICELRHLKIINDIDFEIIMCICKNKLYSEY